MNVTQDGTGHKPSAPSPASRRPHTEPAFRGSIPPERSAPLQSGVGHGPERDRRRKESKTKKGTGNRQQATKRKRAEGQKKAGGHLLSRDGPSIIGAAELDFRVRNGNGYCLRAMATGMYDLPYGRGSRAGLAAGDSRLRTSVRERKPLQTSGRSVRLPDAFRGGSAIWPSLAAY